MPDQPAIQDRIADPGHASSRDYRFNRFSFESLLASLASTFITLSGDEIDAEIEHWMLRVLEYLGLDRSTVIQGMATRESDDVFRFTHTCARKGFEPLEKEVVDDYFPWQMSQLNKGEMVVFSNLDELPPEAAEDRAAFKTRGVRSMAAIPFITRGEYFGALVFTTIGHEHEWTPKTIQRLHLTGQVFASVLLRKRAEMAARRTEQRLLAITHVTSDIIFDCNAKTGALDWLGDIDRLLGYPPGGYPRNLAGWQETLHPEDREKTVAYVQSCIETGEDAVHSYRIRCQDGSYRNWEVRATVVEWDDNGEPIRWAGACSDITARLAAEEDARTLRDQLVHVSRISTLGELTATLAHELNQPLTAILSNAQAALRLLEGDHPDIVEVRAALSDIVKDDQRAGDVIRHLRSFLRNHDFDPVPLSVNELVRQVLSLVQGELSRNRVDLDLLLGNRIPTLEGDRFRLQQVILNLIMNAIEAMSDTEISQRKLRIETSRTEGDKLEISFRDTGKGLDGLDANALFDPFFTTKRDGMGMGLAICKSIIEGHGGQLSGRSNSGCGATFSLTLPPAAPAKP